MEHHQRENCILCQSRDLIKVINLKPTPIADAFVDSSKLSEAQPCYPLDVYFCNQCCHVQLVDVIDPGILFGDYIYETKSSPGLVNHFETYAGQIQEKLGLLKGKRALDIGSNDGTLLVFLKKYEMEVLGIDAAAHIARKATLEGVETLPGFFNAQMADLIRPRGKMDIITANNVYAHADNLGEITRGIQSLLKPDGVFMFEVSWVLDLIKNNVFDFIYHEHLCYHSILSLETFFQQYGLTLFDVHRVSTKGGSIRGYAKLQDSSRPAAPSVAEFIEEEKTLGLDRPEAFIKFESEINQVKKTALKMIDSVIEKGGTVWAYGASATATTLMYHFELADKINCIVDDNLERQGLYSPGAHIPVLPPEKIYEEKPDYIFITAWRFADAIIQKHQVYLEQGGHFIVPLPEVKTI